MCILLPNDKSGLSDLKCNSQGGGSWSIFKSIASSLISGDVCIKSTLKILIFSVYRLMK